MRYRGNTSIDNPAQGNPYNTPPPSLKGGISGRWYRIGPYVDILHPLRFNTWGFSRYVLRDTRASVSMKTGEVTAKIRCTWPLVGQYQLHDKNKYKHIPGALLQARLTSYPNLARKGQGIPDFVYSVWLPTDFGHLRTNQRGYTYTIFSLRIYASAVPTSIKLCTFVRTSVLIRTLCTLKNLLFSERAIYIYQGICFS